MKLKPIIAVIKVFDNLTKIDVLLLDRPIVIGLLRMGHNETWVKEHSHA